MGVLFWLDVQGKVELNDQVEQLDPLQKEVSAAQHLKSLTSMVNLIWL